MKHKKLNLKKASYVRNLGHYFDIELVSEYEPTSPNDSYVANKIIQLNTTQFQKKVNLFLYYAIHRSYYTSMCELIEKLVLESQDNLKTSILILTGETNFSKRAEKLEVILKSGFLKPQLTEKVTMKKAFAPLFDPNIVLLSLVPFSVQLEP